MTLAEAKRKKNDIKLGKRKSTFPAKLNAKQYICPTFSFCSFTAKLRDSRKGRIHEKKVALFWILSKLHPTPNLDNLYNLFLNSKNVDYATFKITLFRK